MDPRGAAAVLAREFLGREPNESELLWAERVIRSILPREEDPTLVNPAQEIFTTR